MTITIPLCVVKRKEENKKIIYTIHPTFLEQPKIENQDLTRAMLACHREIKKELEDIGKDFQHDNLIPWLFDGNVNIITKKIEISMKRNYHKVKIPFVHYTVNSIQYAYPYNYPELTFQLDSKQSLEDRAVEVLEDYFKKELRDYGEDGDNPKDFHQEEAIWIHRMEMELSLSQNKKKKKDDRLLMFSDEETMDGELELHKVGRCLDDHYPELIKASNREDEIEHLEKELCQPLKRPVLLIGKSKVGKSAIIENLVFNRIEKRRKKIGSKENIWHIAPQRLISGMSYVGQWENRLLAIIKEVKKKRLILYFDDLIGLFKAGQTSNSSLSVAMVLKPYIEKKEIRIIAEITPEAFQKLKELDRGFAELFYIVHIEENAEKDVWEILLSVMQQLEYKEGCRFSNEIIPTLKNMMNRYMPHLAFPGKVIEFMNILAVKFKNKKISREDALKTFQEKTGLSLNLLDNQIQLTSKMVEESLKKKIIGQEQAVRKMAEAVSISKAKLNDPEKPQYTFVFLGPTGVGKTECAKSLADYVFSSEKKLIRFDMNEFSSPYAVEQLCGTLHRPEGLLTSAVLQNPFSVILFDEIEKAHPEVYNLLLQVLGEARLTDALGRVINFSGAFIIFTSNLGVKDNWTSTGFISDLKQESLKYLKSVQNFFSPEFYNRLDQIIPFNPLAKEHIKKITANLIEKVFNREGLKRRQSFLNIDEKIIDLCSKEGYHPLLGARFLKRVIEEKIVQPISKELASFPIDSPVIINLFILKDIIEIKIKEIYFQRSKQNILNFAKNNLENELLELEDKIQKIDTNLMEISPSGAISVDEVGSKQYLYFQCRDSIQHIEYELSKLKNKLTLKQEEANTVYLGWEQQRIFYTENDSPDFDLSKMIKSRKIMDYLNDMGVELRQLGTDPIDKFRRVHHEAMYLENLSQLEGDVLIEESYIYIKPLSDMYKEDDFNLFIQMYINFFENELGYELTSIESNIERVRIIKINSPGHFLMTRQEEGLHILLDEMLSLNLYHVWVKREFSEGVDNDSSYNVIRIYNEKDYSYDLKSGYLIEGIPNSKTLKTIKMAAFEAVESAINIESKS